MTIQATALTALAAASEQVERVAERISRTGDVVDLSEEMIQLLAAEAAFKTAVKVVHTAEEMAQHTLDLLA